MKTINIQMIEIAKKYAKALFETSKDCEREVLKNISEINDTIEASDDLKNFLNSPVVKIDKKKETINDIFSGNISHIALNFIYLLCDNSRIDTLSVIVDEFEKLINETENIIIAKAVTAVEMNDELKNKLKEKLENKFKKNFIINYDIDEEIIGGLKLEINGEIFDSTIQNKLKNIRKQLI